MKRFKKKDWPVRYDIGTRRHNGKFIGWSVWKVHPGCTDSCCPVTVAEFYGKGAKAAARYYADRYLGPR